MPADPNAVPIQPLNVGYQFTPSVANLGGSRLFGGSAQLLAGLGDKLMSLGAMFQNSPLFNPEQRAHMREAIARSNLGMAAMQHPSKYPTVGETPQGAVMTAPATLPVSAVTNWNLDEEPPPPPTQPPPPTEPTKPTQPTEKEAKPKSHQEEMGQVSSPNGTRIAQASAVNPNLSASTDNDYAIRRMIQQRGSGAAPEGTPSSLTFLNPATGNVEPRMFAAPATAPPPAAPTTPPDQSGSMLLQGSQPPPSTPGSAISQVTQQPGVALANWQETNIHPVVAPNVVRDALAFNVSTKLKKADVTYQPHGGVYGEPAYAIDLPGGGHSMLSLSQLTSTPWGRSLIQGQNVSQAVQATAPQEQPQNGQQPQPPQTNQPGNMLLQPPPAAPTGPLPGAQGQPPAPQDLTQPPAAPSDYNAAPYRQMVATAMAQPGNLMAQEGQQAGVRSTDPTAAAPASEAPPARTQAETRYASPQTVQIPTAPEQITELNADAASKSSKRVWHPDDTGRFPGTSFTSKPSGRAGFYEQRYYRGSPGWEDGLWTPENQKRQEVLDTYGSAASGIPRSEVLDFDQVKAKSMPEIDALLAKAVWWKTHNLPMEQADQNRLNAESNASKAYQTLLDMSKWTQENKGDPKDFTNNSILKAFEAATRDGVMTQEEGNKLLNDLLLFPPKGQHTQNIPPALSRGWDLAQYAYHDAFAGYQPQHPFSFAVGARMQDLTKALSLLPEYGERAQGEYDWPTHVLGINIPQWHLEAGVPVATNPSKIPEINSMVTGASPAEATRNYTEMKRRVDEQYIKDVQNYAYAGKRVPQTDIDNMTALSKPNGKIKDDNNPMRDRTTDKLINPYDPTHYADAGASPTPSPTPSPTRRLPQISKYDPAEFKRLGIGKGDQYLGPDGTTTFTRGE